jgi:hypothetical protein
MNKYGINNGLQRREVVKNEIKKFLEENNNKITLVFSKKMYKKYGFTPSAIGGLVSELR